MTHTQQDQIKKAVGSFRDVRDHKKIIKSNPKKDPVMIVQEEIDKLEKRRDILDSWFFKKKSYSKILSEKIFFCLLTCPSASTSQFHKVYNFHLIKIFFIRMSKSENDSKDKKEYRAHNKNRSYTLKVYKI